MILAAYLGRRIIYSSSVRISLTFFSIFFLQISSWGRSWAPKLWKIQKVNGAPLSIVARLLQLHNVSCRTRHMIHVYTRWCVRLPGLSYYTLFAALLCKTSPLQPALLSSRSITTRCLYVWFSHILTRPNPNRNPAPSRKGFVVNQMTKASNKWPPPPPPARCIPFHPPPPPPSVPPLPPPYPIRFFDRFSCGVLESTGRVECWGDGALGGLSVLEGRLMDEVRVILYMYGMVWCDVIRHGLIWCGVVWYGMV